MQARQDISAVLDELKNSFPDLLRSIPLNTEKYDLFASALPCAAHIAGFIRAVRSLKEKGRLLNEFLTNQPYPPPSLSAFDVGLRAILESKLSDLLLLSVTECNIHDLIKYSSILFHEDTGPAWANIALECFTQRHLDAIMALCNVEEDESLVRQNFLAYVNQHMLPDSSALPASSSMHILASISERERALSEMARMLWRLYGQRIPDQNAQELVCQPIRNYLNIQPVQCSFPPVVRSTSLVFSHYYYMNGGGREALLCLDRIQTSAYECFDAYSGLSAYQVLALSMLAGSDYRSDSRDPPRAGFLKNMGEQLEICQRFNQQFDIQSNNWLQYPARERLYIVAENTARFAHNLSIDALIKANVDESQLSDILLKRQPALRLGQRCSHQTLAAAKWQLALLLFLADRQDVPDYQDLLIRAFPIAVQLGYFTEVTWLYERIDPAKRAVLLTDNNYQIFAQAVDGASIRVMDYLFGFLTSPEQQHQMVSANDYAVIRAALTTSIRLPARQRLLEKLAAWLAPVPFRDIFVSNQFDAFDQVFALGETATLGWMLDMIAEDQRLPAIESISPSSVEEAAQAGHSAAIIWLLNWMVQTGDREKVYARIKQAFPAAAKANQFKVALCLLTAVKDRTACLR